MPSQQHGIVVQSPEPVNFPTMGSWPDFQHCAYVSPVDHALNPVRKRLVIPHHIAPVVSMAYVSMLVIIVVLKAHNWLRLLMIFPLQQPTEYLPVLRQLASREEAFWAAPPDSSCPVSKVCVFNRGVLPSSSDVYSRAMSIAYVVWRGAPGHS